MTENLGSLRDFSRLFATFYYFTFANYKTIEHWTPQVLYQVRNYATPSQNFRPAIYTHAHENSALAKI